MKSFARIALPLVALSLAPLLAACGDEGCTPDTSCSDSEQALIERVCEVCSPNQFEACVESEEFNFCSRDERAICGLDLTESEAEECRAAHQAFIDCAENATITCTTIIEPCEVEANQQNISCGGEGQSMSCPGVDAATCALLGDDNLCETISPQAGDVCELGMCLRKPNAELDVCECKFFETSRTRCEGIATTANCVVGDFDAAEQTCTLGQCMVDPDPLGEIVCNAP